MRSYNQYCALAKALDIVGERWTLLVVRELLDGPRRYSELQEDLPGIASNLLATRLHNLAETGVVARADDGRWTLTSWGENLAEPVEALMRWGAPLMRDRHPDDVFRNHWLAGPIEMIFGGFDPGRPHFVAEIRAGDKPMTIESVDGYVRLHAGPAAAPELVLTGPAEGIIGLLSGRLDRRRAEDIGVRILGDERPLAQLRRPGWGSGPEASKPAS
jgi:DNA-binding HxlR family transcriptional regulator